MISKRYAGLIGLAVAGTFALTSCAANEEAAPPAAEGSTGTETAALSGTISGMGSSAQGSAQEAWIAAFQTANTGVTVNYDPSGSGAGREAFIAGGAAWAGSDSALSDEELAGEFPICAPDTLPIDLPTYISPIAVIFNVEGVDELNLDAPTIAAIFKGEITSWDDPAIAELNEDAELPSADITAVHRSDDSGTTKNFADYLFKVAPDVWTEEPADPFPYETGEGAQGTSGVVDAVTNGTNTIGYADASKAGDLGTAKIKVGDDFVEYTAAGAAAVVAESPLVEGREANDIAVSLDRTTTDPSHYPLVLVSYSIVCQEYADPEQGALAKAYVTYITSAEGQAEAEASAGAAPLNEDLSGRVATAIETVK